MGVVSFQGDDTSGQLEKNYDEFEAIDMDKTRVRRRQFAAALDSLGPVDVEPKTQVC